MKNVLFPGWNYKTYIYTDTKKIPTWLPVICILQDQVFAVPRTALGSATSFEVTSLSAPITMGNTVAFNLHRVSSLNPLCISSFFIAKKHCYDIDFAIMKNTEIKTKNSETDPAAGLL